MSERTPVRLHVAIDPNRCVGSTMCIQYAPGAFELGDRRQAVVHDAEGESVARLREAAEQCPMSAIILTDAETGEQVFP